jgi:hypothetical protein
LDELAKQSEVQSHERVERKCGRYMERKIVFLPGEISYPISNICSDTEVGFEKSADAIVVIMPNDEGLNVKFVA